MFAPKIAKWRPARGGCAPPRLPTRRASASTAALMVSAHWHLAGACLTLNTLANNEPFGPLLLT